MIAKLLRLALTQRFLSVVLGVGLVALGVWAFMQLSVEAYPDISDTQVVVITLYPGHAAEAIKQYQIEVDPVALGKYGLSIKDIAQAVDSNNQNAGGALLDNRQQGLVVRGVGLIQSIADIENVVVSASGGVPVFVRDVGRVHVGPAPRSGIFAVGTETDHVEGIVLMRRGENPSQVLKGVHEAIDELNGSMLPPGAAIVPIYDRTDLVDNTLHTVP